MEPVAAAVAAAAQGKKRCFNYLFDFAGGRGYQWFRLDQATFIIFNLVVLFFFLLIVGLIPKDGTYRFGDAPVS